MDIPEIHTDRLLLRAFRAEDIDALARIYRDPDVERQLVPMTREDAEEQVAYFMAHWEYEGFGLWAAEERASGAMVGRIGLGRHPDFPEEPDPVEVGWTLAPRYWGRGLATEGGGASLRFAFEHLSLDRVVSITRNTNHRSRRVMERLGLTYQGPTRWRGFDDHVYYAIDRGTWERSAAGGRSP